MEYARRGAQARIDELHAELNRIYKQFPDLRRSGRRAMKTVADTLGVRMRRRKRKPMSSGGRPVAPTSRLGGERLLLTLMEFWTEIAIAERECARRSAEGKQMARYLWAFGRISVASLTLNAVLRTARAVSSGSLSAEMAARVTQGRTVCDEIAVLCTA